MLRPCAALLALVGLAVLVAGCQRGAAAERSYFPLVEGARWSYAVRSPMGSMDGTRIDVEAKGSVPVLGLEDRVFLMHQSTSGDTEAGRIDTGPVAYRVEGGYVARYTSLRYDRSGRLRLLGEDPPIRLIPSRPTHGQEWYDFSSHFASPGGSDGYPVEWRAEVQRAEPVDVPAGHFEDVVEVSSHYVENREIGRDLAVHYLDYYARGVGRVRSVIRDPGGDRTKRIEHVLVEYELPGTR